MRSLPNIIKTSNYNERIVSSLGKTDRETISDDVTLLQQEAMLRPAETAEDILSEAKQKAAKAFEHTVKEAELIAAAIKEDAKRLGEEIKKQNAEHGYAEGFENGKTQGYTKGFEEGYEEGLKRAQNENRYVLDSLTEVANSIQAQKEERLEQFSDGLQDIVLLIAKAVLKYEVELHPEFLAQQAFEAISDYNAHAWIKIMVSESSYRTICENVPEFTQRLGGNVKLFANPELSNSDCMCETPSQMIDAGIDTQFANIEQTLREE